MCVCVCVYIYIYTYTYINVSMYVCVCVFEHSVLYQVVMEQFCIVSCSLNTLRTGDADLRF